jgi:hypothetical protein
MNLTRACYLVAVCSGLRAMFNLLLSARYDPGRVSCLDDVVVNLDDSGLARIRVHGKRRPANGCSSAKYGMISLELVHSGVHPLLDRILRLMSHFGCGHLELAYMEKDDRLEIYAVRNIAKANVSRLRLRQIFSSLKPITMEEEHLVLSKILSLLGDRGITSSLAPPIECCRLAISPGLLNPRTERVTKEWLLRKYQRISKKLEFRSNEA